LLAERATRRKLTARKGGFFLHTLATEEKFVMKLFVTDSAKKQTKKPDTPSGMLCCA